MSANSSRARNKIATKPLQRFGTPTVESPRGATCVKRFSRGARGEKLESHRPPFYGFTRRKCATSVHGSCFCGTAVLRNAIVGISVVCSAGKMHAARKR